MRKTKEIDILVLGAGPSGLAFGHTLLKSKFNGKLLILDQGKDLINRGKYDSKDAYQGVGGAGLYSDGKFSFFPSSSKLWELNQPDLLRKSYDEVVNLLKMGTDLVVPPFPEDYSKLSRPVSGEQYLLKEYPSLYLSFPERENLINNMIEVIGDSILTEKRVVKIEKEEGSYLVYIKDLSKNENFKISCNKLVIAGGKLFPLIMNEEGMKFKREFRRFEVGIRLVGPDECFTSLYPKIKDLNDPKWFLNDISKENVEVKTFCMCKNAETILCDYEGIKCFSGRADCPPTGFTNFGLNLVIKDEKLFDLNLFLENTRGSFSTDLETVLIEEGKFFKKIMGEVCGGVLTKACELLASQFKLSLKDIKILGPTFEGVGYYPAIDKNLQLLEDKNVFVIGDCGGLFRGITSAMVSGSYAANLVLSE